MTPRYASRTPTRGGTSFQRFRADAPELSNEEQAFWNYATLPPLESEWDAERLMPHDEYRVLSKATSGGGFLVPTDLAAKTIRGRALTFWWRPRLTPPPSGSPPPNITFQGLDLPNPAQVCSRCRASA